MGSKIISEFTASGFDCKIIEQLWSGHLCGYVRLPEDHPLFQVDYFDESFPNFDVHGGITFSGSLFCEGFYVGFDCAHYDDICPKRVDEVRSPTATFKDETFVKEELLYLADQLSRVTKETKTITTYTIGPEQ